MVYWPIGDYRHRLLPCSCDISQVDTPRAPNWAPQNRTIECRRRIFTPARGSSASPLLLDLVAQVGDSGCRPGLGQAQPDVGGQVLEEAAAVAEEHGNLVQDHLVEQPGAQRARGDTAAHDPDVPAAREGAGALDAASMEVTKVCV